MIKKRDKDSWKDLKISDDLHPLLFVEIKEQARQRDFKPSFTRK